MIIASSRKRWNFKIDNFYYFEVLQSVLTLLDIHKCFIMLYIIIYFAYTKYEKYIFDDLSDFQHSLIKGDSQNRYFIDNIITVEEEFNIF